MDTITRHPLGHEQLAQRIRDAEDAGRAVDGGNGQGTQRRILQMPRFGASQRDRHWKVQPPAQSHRRIPRRIGEMRVENAYAPVTAQPRNDAAQRQRHRKAVE